MLILILALSACGNNSPTGSSGTPTPTPGQTTGCPNSATAPSSPTPATVTLTSAADSGRTVSVQKGDTIEVHLAFGKAWSGPMNFSQDLLSLQSPAGYASSTAQACVWRFVANNPGTAQLTFTGRPICKKGELCPQYILATSFTITIK